uniref:Peptidase C1A papain C-terminal domain-containing protein n=1 Tax=Anopheles minimus TaxID=112268 RepID=A0A182VQA7_9DIPT
MSQPPRGHALQGKETFAIIFHLVCKNANNALSGVPFCHRTPAGFPEWSIMPKNEDALAFALWKVGPIPVSINAAPKSFQLYSNGIYDDEASCDNSKVNHAMLLLGYTKDYWILKNWWGSWGEDGYMRLARGKNLCGISNYAGYVTV